MTSTDARLDARATLRPSPDHVPLQADWIEQTLGEAIERQVAANPERVAVRMDGSNLSYGELGKAADVVAGSLVDAGIGRRPRSDGLPPIVAVACEQSIELIVAIVGILKAGAAYVPIDPSRGAEVNGALLEKVGAEAVVHDVSSDDPARELARPRRPLVLASVDPAAGAPSRVVPVRDADPNAVAYVYATSGSTGAAKAVMDSHRNVLHNVRRYTNTLGIGPDDRLSLVQSSTFSGAVSSLFAALVNGATCQPFDVRRRGAAALGRWARDEGLTMFHAVPALFRALCTDGAEYPDMRVVRLEGDAASWADVAAFQARLPRGCVLVNGLGATETGLVRQFFVDHDTPLGEGGLPLGHPVPDVDVRIVGDGGGTLGPGEIGEIEVRSEFLALGYLGDPGRTAAAFTADGGVPRAYRTGDLGRLDADGCLVGLGRADFADKINGERVDLPEVERLLRLQRGIADAVAVTRREGSGPPRLVAYAVATDVPPRPDVLRRAVRSRLPGSHVPSSIVFLDRLPLDASGKVDRRRLPAASAGRPELEVAYRAPGTRLERELVEVWEEVLGVRPVGVDDDFFDLGGDSLDAARLIVALSERPDIDAADDAVAEAATVAELARRLSRGAAVDRTVWFAVPGDRTNLASYARVQRAFDGTVVLRPVGAPPQPDDPIDIAADAAAIAAEIRAVQPAGPYFLTGFCFGAVTALEVANELAARGAAIGAVALLAITPLEFPDLIDRCHDWSRGVRFRRWVRRNVRQTLAAGQPSAIGRHLGRQLAWVTTRELRAVRRRLATRGAVRLAPNAPLLDRRLVAIAAHPARPLDGPLTVVLGAESARRYTQDPAAAWRRLGGEVDVILRPGDDEAMLADPGAAGLAKVLARIASRGS